MNHLIPSAYMGDDPYIFISYAHKDSEKVFSFIEALQKKYNVWFDTAVHFGEEWDNEIAQKLLGCSVFLFMASENSLASRHCKGELGMAYEEKKPFINIMMEDSVELPPWFRLKYMIFQYCRLSLYPSLDEAVEELTRRSTFFTETKKAEVKPAKEDTQGTKETAADTANGSLAVIKRLPKSESTALKIPFDGAPFLIEPNNDGFLLKGLKGSKEEKRKKKRLLVDVSIPDGVTSIGAFAFQGCSALKSIIIPESVKHIGEGAFQGCVSLSNVSLEPGASVIERGAFSCCDALKQIVIPEGVISIGDSAFARCYRLKKVILPQSIKSIGKSAFETSAKLYYRGAFIDWDKIDMNWRNWYHDRGKVQFNYMDITKLSRVYTVRELNDDDAEAVAAICRGNPLFYEHCAQEPTREQVLADMHDAPPDADPALKHYVGFFEGSEMIAVMDIVDGYPAPETAYIGFFMLAKSMQGRGVGSAIVREAEGYLKSVGKVAIRLAINKGNPQSSRFWEKNGFAVIREVKRDGWVYRVAEKKL